MKTMLDKWMFSLNGSSWENVTVPHDWAVSRPVNREMDHAYEQGFLDRWGVGEYKTVVDVNYNKDSRYFLEFDGVYENCCVSVNGQIVGNHKYGYSGFSFEITDAVKHGENSVQVVVDNTTRPVDRWYSGCGIYRKVYLTEVPCKYIDRNNVVITADLNGNITIETGLDEAVNARITINGSTYEADGTRSIAMKVSGFEAWSAEKPSLYALQLTLIETGHTEVFKIGFRNVQISAKGFFINGRQDKLRGVCVHQDASCFGTAVPVEIWRERLLLLKDYGVNAVRLTHHLFMPEVLDLCDEIGLYVYEECFDKWKSGLYERYYDDCWRDDIAAMVKRDRNRPSIIIWGVGNEVENQTSEESLEILSNHCKYVKQLDSTRPVTFAIFPWFWRDCEVSAEESEDVIGIYGEDSCDIAYRVKYIKRMAEFVDIIGCNYQEPWYENYHKALPDMPILGTEIYQYFRGYPQNVNAYDDSIPWLDVENNDYVVGGFVWAGFDYLGESMGWPAKGWTGSLFATDMEPKTGAYIHRSYWDTKPFVHFAVMDYTVADEFTKEQWDMPRYVSHWDFSEVRKSVVPFMIASNCDEVILKLNDKIMLQKNPVDFKNRIITGFIPYFEGKIEVFGMKAGVQVCSYSVKTPDKAERLEFDAYDAPSDSGVIMLKVRAKDSKGVVCFKESADVSFEVSGDAEILGTDNGNLLNHTPYNSSSVELYRGRASVAVKLWGKAQIVAKAEKMKSAEIHLD